MAGRIDKKVAVVTGAAAGIGWAIANRLASEGAQVIALDIDAAGLANLEDHADGNSLKTKQVDITNEVAIRDCISGIVASYGTIDILVNDAAKFVLKGIDASLSDWQESFSVNVFGAALCTKYVARAMTQQCSGSIVNLTSISGVIAQPLFLTYSATRAAIIQMTKNLALDLGKNGIRVNSVSPGTIITSASQKHADKLGITLEEFKKIESDKTVLNKVGSPEDVANAVLFLASEEASFITGANLMIDGGYTIQ